MNEMLRYTIIRVILFVMGGFLVLGCSDEDDAVSYTHLTLPTKMMWVIVEERVNMV